MSYMMILCRTAGIETSRTTLYHLVGNGQVELCFRCLGHWKITRKVIGITHLDNSSHLQCNIPRQQMDIRHFFLMFGRHPRLVIDVFLGLTPDAVSAPTIVHPYSATFHDSTGYSPFFPYVWTPSKISDWCFLVFDSRRNVCSYSDRICEDA